MNLLTLQVVYRLFRHGCSLRTFYPGGVTILSSPGGRMKQQIGSMASPSPARPHSLMSLNSMHVNASPRPRIKSQSVSDPQSGFDELVNPDPQSAMWAPPHHDGRVPEGMMRCLHWPAGRGGTQGSSYWPDLSMFPRVSYSSPSLASSQSSCGGGWGGGGVYGVWTVDEHAITPNSTFPPVTLCNAAQEKVQTFTSRPQVVSFCLCLWQIH